MLLVYETLVSIVYNTSATIKILGVNLGVLMIAAEQVNFLQKLWNNNILQEIYTQALTIFPDVRRRFLSICNIKTEVEYWNFKGRIGRLKYQFWSICFMDVLLNLNIYYPSMAYYHQGKPVFDTTYDKINSWWRS